MEAVPELDVRDGDLIVQKTACDSFLGTSLDATLKSNAIDRLVVTAAPAITASTPRCAAAGARLCQNRAGGRPHDFQPADLTAQQIIAHHNSELG